MKIQELRKLANSIGREGLSLAAIEMVEQFDGSYKGAIELCGKLSVIARACSFDSYWQEKVDKGERSAEYLLELLAKEGVNK